tara:strand:- start:270 stop:581 length:312 start_codon:yes stop_codon:yes gene_type:complete
MNDDVKNDSVEAAETEAPEVNHVNNMVSSLVDGDNIAAQDSFKNALTDKIGSALDDKRKTVANDWLNAAIETNDEAEDSSSEETPAEQEGEEEVEQEDEPVVS